MSHRSLLMSCHKSISLWRHRGCLELNALCDAMPSNSQANSLTSSSKPGRESVTVERPRAYGCRPARRRASTLFQYSSKVEVKVEQGPGNVSKRRWEIPGQATSWTMGRGHVLHNTRSSPDGSRTGTRTTSIEYCVSSSGHGHGQGLR